MYKNEPGIKATEVQFNFVIREDMFTFNVKWEKNPGIVCVW